jgi:predicted translin family RNA/ssDNA-binding protein
MTEPSDKEYATTEQLFNMLEVIQTMQSQFDVVLDTIETCVEAVVVTLDKSKLNDEVVSGLRRKHDAMLEAYDNTHHAFNATHKKVEQLAHDLKLR